MPDSHTGSISTRVKRQPAGVRASPKWYTSPSPARGVGTGAVATAGRSPATLMWTTRLALRGPVTVQVDQHVGDDVLGPLLRRVVPGGLGNHGGATLGLAAGRPHRGLLDQEGGHVVEAGLVQAGAQPGDQVDDLRPVGELLQLGCRTHGCLLG